jgi:hypothetical protein
LESKYFDEGGTIETARSVCTILKINHGTFLDIPSNFMKNEFQNDVNTQWKLKIQRREFHENFNNDKKEIRFVTEDYRTEKGFKVNDDK